MLPDSTVTEHDYCTKQSTNLPLRFYYAYPLINIVLKITHNIYYLISYKNVLKLTAFSISFGLQYPMGNDKIICYFFFRHKHFLCNRQQKYHLQFSVVSIVQNQNQYRRNIITIYIEYFGIKAGESYSKNFTHANFLKNSEHRSPKKNIKYLHQHYDCQ